MDNSEINWESINRLTKKTIKWECDASLTIYADNDHFVGLLIPFLETKQFTLEAQNKTKNGWFYYTTKNFLKYLKIKEDRLLRILKKCVELKLIATKLDGNNLKWFKVNHKKIVEIRSSINAFDYELEQSVSEAEDPFLPNPFQEDTAISVENNPPPRESPTSSPGIPDLIPGNPRYYKDIINKDIINKRNINIASQGDALDGRLAALKEKTKERTSTIKKPPFELKKETKEILEYWNQKNWTTKHSIEKQTKTLHQIDKYITQLLHGNFVAHCTNVTTDWLEKNGAQQSMAHKLWTIAEIKEGIDRLSLQQLPGYWPYEQQAKKRLSTSLSTCLYAPMNKMCPSPFLKVMARKPMKSIHATREEAEAQEPVKNKVAFDMMVELFYTLWDETTVPEKDKSVLKTVVNRVEAEKNRMHKEIGQYLQGNPQTMSDYNYHFLDKEQFWVNYRSFLAHVQVPKMESMGSSLEINMVFPGTKTWQGFLKWLRREYHLNLCPTEDEMRVLKKLAG